MIELLAKEIIKPIVSSIVEYIKDDTKAQVYAENMQRLLTSNYKTRSGVKNILHSVTPVPFMDIYCPLKIKMLSSDFQRDYGSQPVESVKTLLNNVNNIAIFGNAGCGKSTLVNFLFYNQDQNSVRGLFANGKVENYLAEIDNLTEKADQILALQKRDDNFINSLMDLS